jgi:hypothetical protein
MVYEAESIHHRQPNPRPDQSPKIYFILITHVVQFFDKCVFALSHFKINKFIYSGNFSFSFLIKLVLLCLTKKINKIVLLCFIWLNIEYRLLLLLWTSLEYVPTHVCILDENNNIVLVFFLIQVKKLDLYFFSFFTMLATRIEHRTL